MSKAFAFAGARVGYLAANKGIIDCVRIVRMPYPLSAVTQAAALAAFEHTDEQLSRVAHLRETRNATSAWLKEQTYKGQPLEVAETQSNFILFGGHLYPIPHGDRDPSAGENGTARRAHPRRRSGRLDASVHGHRRGNGTVP